MQHPTLNGSNKKQWANTSWIATSEWPVTFGGHNYILHKSENATPELVAIYIHLYTKNIFDINHLVVKRLFLLLKSPKREGMQEIVDKYFKTQIISFIIF